MEVDTDSGEHAGLGGRVGLLNFGGLDRTEGQKRRGTLPHATKVRRTGAGDQVKRSSMLSYVGEDEESNPARGSQENFQKSQELS